MTYAIIDMDGTRFVYWGLGSTPNRARIEAEAQEGYQETEHNACVEVSDTVVTRVRKGDVAIRCGKETLMPDDRIRRCVLPSGHAGYCDAA